MTGTRGPAYLAERSPAELTGVLAGGTLTPLLFFGMLGQWAGGRLSETRTLRAAYAGATLLGALAVASVPGILAATALAAGAWARGLRQQEIRPREVRQ